MKKLLQNSKGQIQSIAPAILALIFAAVVLVFGIIVIASLQDSVSTVSGAGNNVTIIMNVTTPRIPAGNYSQCGFNQFSVSFVSYVNQTTAGKTIASGNYTINTATGTIDVTNVDPSYLENVAWNFTYTFNYGEGDPCIAANKTIEGIATFADFWEIIVLAIVISVVIGLLLVIFGRQSRR